MFMCLFILTINALIYFLPSARRSSKLLIQILWILFYTSSLVRYNSAEKVGAWLHYKWWPFEGIAGALFACFRLHWHNRWWRGPGRDGALTRRPIHYSLHLHTDPPPPPPDSLTSGKVHRPKDSFSWGICILSIHYHNLFLCSLIRFCSIIDI